MKSTRVLLVCIAAMAGSAASATAQISPTGPFTGPTTESFETQTAHQFTPCVVERVFGGTADLCDSMGSNMHITTGWGFFCTIFPNSGGKLAASAGGPAKLTFDDAVNKFGGYFGTNAGAAGGTIEFFDASGASIGTAPLNVEADCSWRWNGWESTTPVKSVVITGANSFGGGYVMMDDLEYERGGTTPTCYANCDGSTSEPILNVNDFICFQTSYAAGNPGANCDGSTTEPILNVNDFICFQSAYAAGCP